jgi:hypothetical protein
MAFDGIVRPYEEKGNKSETGLDRNFPGLGNTVMARSCRRLSG